LPDSHSLPIHSILFFAAVAAFLGCSKEYHARYYDAPKIESEFVKGREPKPRQAAPPMMGGSRIPLPERRILGAVIPDKENVYFVKATDRTAHLASAESAFRTVVETFAIDPASGSPKFELPSGWSLNLLDNANAGIGLAEMIAEINYEAPAGRIRFTVSKYNKPSETAAWENYLLSQINRWRGQLELPPTTVPNLVSELPTIPREGAALPAYLFDANGGGASGSTASGTTPSGTSAVETAPVSAEPIIPAAPATRPALKLTYDKPENWELQAAKPYREATFKVTKEGKEAEVTVSTARDTPVQNAGMWATQTTQVNDPSAIEAMAKKTVEEAETLQVGTKTAKLYSIRASDQPDARSLLVVAIPMGEGGMSMFVKLNCELRMMEEEKSTFLSFVNTLRWE